MSDVSPINSYAHLSGEPPGSPEQGPSGPTPNTTALELPEPEGHNLLTPLALKLGSGAVAPRPFAARLRSLLAARILHFLGLPKDLYDPNHKYNHATLRAMVFSPRTVLRSSCHTFRTSPHRSNESSSHNPDRRKHD